MMRRRRQNPEEYTALGKLQYPMLSQKQVAIYS
jgi:hypothetical protein